MLPSFARDTVQVLSPGWKTVHGNTEPDFDTATTRTVTGATIQPLSAGEDNDHRVAGVLVTHQGWLPPEDPITVHDRIVWNGESLDVIGEPNRWHQTSTAHVHVQLQRWRG